MTTNETSWFRDRQPFDALQPHLLPDLMARRARERRLTIWSAACSSGQEPYSIAMLLRECLPMHAGWSVQILATDISRDAGERASAAGTASSRSTAACRRQLLVKHFERDGQGVGGQAGGPADGRRSARCNLARPLAAVPPCDVVFLRNVLIYFDIETKQQVLSRVRSVLRPDGYLFLGGAETTLNVDEAYEPVQFDRATCYRVRSGEVQR